MKELEEKYIKLLLERCMKIKEKEILFISYDIINQNFVDKIKKHALDLGLKEVYLDASDIYEKKDVLNSISKEEIKKHPLFNAHIWDEHAKKDAAFLMISSELPCVLDGVSIEKLALASKVKMESKPLYKKKQKDNELTWLIAVFPNKVWAKAKFPDLDEDTAYEKLFDLMMDVTLCHENDPIESWNQQLELQSQKMQKLNDLKIKSLHYTNSLGTDLTVELSDLALWQSAGSEENAIIVNMPSYEVFTSPNCYKTSGIVYSSKPLVYNSRLIDEFWIKFADGKVIDFDAKEGKELLKEIIEGDEGSKMLGEVALVGKNSPIAKTNFVFGETCLDENASCHIALGAGFTECIDKANKMDEKEIKKIGLNDSKNHVDFMIGTDDLMIEAKTNQGAILIFKDGEFNI